MSRDDIAALIQARDALADILERLRGLQVQVSQLRCLEGRPAVAYAIMAAQSALQGPMVDPLCQALAELQQTQKA